MPANDAPAPSYQLTLSGDVVETTLVNVSEHGREGVRMIDRSTRFGNPFKMKQDGGEYTREGCVEAYREWFREQLDDDDFRRAVAALRGETLGCHCAPEPCHGDVILDYLQGEIDVE